MNHFSPWIHLPTMTAHQQQQTKEQLQDCHPVTQASYVCVSLPHGMCDSIGYTCRVNMA